MGKLNLVIADTDEGYAKGVANYISARNSRSFHVNCFTNPDALRSFLQFGKDVDILLVCPEFFNEVKNFRKARLTLVLSQGVLNGEYSGYEVLHKYQTGERLVSSMLFLYTKANPEDIFIGNQERVAKVIGVYSPAGGAGTTTIAASLSIQWAEQGMPAFYLNLEHIQSTPCYFDCSNERNLSYVLYYLKEKNKNLAFRLDGVKSIDPVTGVHYFSPPQNALEFDETGSEELELLVHQLKNSGHYDYVVIDIPGGFNARTVKLLELCDWVVLTSSDDLIARRKLENVTDNLQKLDSARESKLMDKLIYVLNKYNAEPYENESISDGSAVFRVKLPQFENCTVPQGGKLIINDNEFRKAIDVLIGIISDR